MFKFVFDVKFCFILKNVGNVTASCKNKTKIIKKKFKTKKNKIKYLKKSV